MLSKEEIESLLKEISQEFRAIPQVKNILYPLDINQFQKLSKYTEQLETKEQKLIEKLEKEKYKIECTYSQINGNYFMAQDRLDLIKEILSMIKGEE